MSAAVDGRRDYRHRDKEPPYRGYDRRRSRSRSRERYDRRNGSPRPRHHDRNGQLDRREKEKRQRETEYYEKRRQEREKLSVNGVPEVWALSPERPEFDSDDEEVIKQREQAELMDRLARREEKERSRKKKKKKYNKHSSKKGRKSKKSRKVSETSEEDSPSEESGEEDEEEEGEGVWVEKRVQQEPQGAFVGPTPEIKVQAITSMKDYGHALLPGEGEAMAAYVESGKRIPRRGEIGLTCNEITTFEDAGYVMSGSRHRRMEAVRIRKENQVYNADDRRALANFNREERLKKENEVMSAFRTMIHHKNTSK